MKIGIVGLGARGHQILDRLLKDHHEVVVHPITPDAEAVARALGAIVAPNIQELVANLGDHPVVWLMLDPSEVENTMSEVLDHMSNGIIIDGANSDYRETMRRAKLTSGRGVEFVDVGVAGGVQGGERGFSITIGGDRASVDSIQALFQSLCQPSGWGYFGTSGAGHFTHMVHTAMEYAIMEAYGEGYHLLHDNADFTDLDLAHLAGVWQHGSAIESRFNDLTGQILRASPNLDSTVGVVPETGETRWALEQANQLHIPLPAVQAALNVRVGSQKSQTNFATKLVEQLRNTFNGYATKGSKQ
jgi:6-phosphogluconate dehydrogenase